MEAVPEEWQYRPPERNDGYKKYSKPRFYRSGIKYPFHLLCNCNYKIIDKNTAHDIR